MNEELQEKLVRRFTKRFQNYNEKVLYELGQAIKEIGDVIPSDAYKLSQQLKYNMTVEDLEKELMKITKKSKEEIQKILEYIAKENIAFAKPYYEAKGLNAPIYEEHKELQNIVNSMAKLSNNEFINIARSTGFKLLDINKKPLLLNLKETYDKVIDEAVYAVTTGKDNYNQLMREILKELASSGVRKIEYESGYTRRIDTSIRMNLMDTIRQVSNECQKLFGKEFGADGVEITVRINPAPDHERCQGRQFSIEEFNKFQNYEKCQDYRGNIYFPYENGKKRRKISEYNCHHIINQIILGVDNPMHSDKDLQKIIDNNNKGVEIDGKHYTNYEFTQVQRRLETEIRKAKEQNIIATSAGDEDLVLSSQQRITSLMNKYKQVSKQANMNIDVSRTFVPDYKLKKDKEKLPYKDVTKEWLDKATPKNCEIIEDNIYYKDSNGAKYYVDGKNVIYSPSLEEIETANWLRKTFGGKIRIQSKVNNPKYMKCSDYKWTVMDYQEEKWDLKTLGKEAISKNRAVDNNIKKAKGQSNNFIIKMGEDCTLTNEEIITQVKRLYGKQDRNWIDKIIIRKKDDVIGIYIRK